MAYSFHQHQPSPSCFDQLNNNYYDDYPESLSSSSSNSHRTEYGDSRPVIIPPTPPRIAVNTRLNLLSRFEDAIGPFQLFSWINASASLKKKITVSKVGVKVTSSQNQTDNTTQGKASTEITPYHTKTESASRISSKCNQKTQGSTKVKESPVVHNFIDNDRQVNGKIIHFYVIFL